MERAKEILELSKYDSNKIVKLAVNPHTPNVDKSFYDEFCVRGIQIDRFEPRLVVSSFKVPPRLTDMSGNLAPGAIANLVDMVGGAVIHQASAPMNVSVTMSISYVSTAKVDDELEITSRLLGRKGPLSAIVVSIKNKATGETVAEGQHTLFSRSASKI